MPGRSKRVGLLRLSVDIYDGRLVRLGAPTVLRANCSHVCTQHQWQATIHPVYLPYIAARSAPISQNVGARTCRSGG